MAVETIKSAAIQAWEALTSPFIVKQPTAGKGGRGFLSHQDGFVQVSAAASITSKYPLARIPSTAIVKAVRFSSDAQGAGSMDIGLYYSSGKNDGTAVANQGTVIDADFFASAVAVTSASKEVDVTNESGNYPLQERQMPIWEAAGLTSDPGGMFDIVATVVSADVTTGTGYIYAQVQFIIP